MRCYVLPTMPRKVDNYRADGQRSGTTPARGVNEEIYTLQRIQCQEGGYMSLQEPWQLDGNAEEWYERYLVPAIFGPWAADLVALAAPQPGERVLDVACGSGVVARLVA